MFLLLFHGTEILGFLAGVVLGGIGFLSIFAWLLNSPPRRPVVPAVVYLALASGAYLCFLFVEAQNSELLPDAGFFLALPHAFLFPWSVVSLILFEYLNVDSGEGGIVAGAPINALLIYAVGKWARRRKNATDMQLSPTATNL